MVNFGVGVGFKNCYGVSSYILMTFVFWVLLYFCSIMWCWVSVCSQRLFFLNLLGLRLLLGCDNMSVKQTHKWKIFLAGNLKTNRKLSLQMHFLFTLFLSVIRRLHPYWQFGRVATLIVSFPFKKKFRNQLMSLDKRNLSSFFCVRRTF